MLEGQIKNPAGETLDRVWIPTIPPPKGREATRTALDAWCEQQVRQAVQEYLCEGLFWLSGQNVQFTPADPMCMASDPKLARPLSDLLAEVISSDSLTDSRGESYIAPDGREKILELRNEMARCVSMLDAALRGRPRCVVTEPA